MTTNRSDIDALKEDLAALRQDMKALVVNLKTAGHDKVEQVEHRLSEQAHHCADRVKHGWNSAREAGHDVAVRGEEIVRDHPLMTSLAALGTGMLLGRLLRRRD